MSCTVGIASKRARYFVALRTVLAGVLLACPSALSLDRNLDVNQYAHRAWTVRDGFVASGISSIAQTPDGYLWLGTGFGLLRFDGVRVVPWQPPAGQRLAFNYILSLLAARDGRLWIGAYNGLASWKAGKLTHYPELAEYFISTIAQDREGTVWVGAYSALPNSGRLCAIRKDNIECSGKDGSLGRGVVSVYEDKNGDLWVGVQNGLWRWKPGPPKFYSLPGEPDGIQALGEDAVGTLLVGWNGGIYRFMDGKTERYQATASLQRFRAKRLLRDRNGSLWIGTVERGILHVHRGRMDVFRPSDSLSGEGTNSLLEDREGNIWVATTNGLDRFHDVAVPSLTTKQGLSNDAVSTVLADKDGSVWFSTRTALDRWQGDRSETYRVGFRESTPKPEYGPTSLFQDDRVRLWVATLTGFGYLENGRFLPISGIPGGNVLSIVQDTTGDLWVDNESVAGLFRLSPQNQVRKIPWAELGHQDHASVLAADPRGGIWIGFFLGGIAYFADGQIRTSYTAADGLGAGRVGQIRLDQDSTLWAATEGGLSRLKNGRIATLTTKNGLSCDPVHWAIEDDDRALWLYTPCGLVRVARAELDAWAAAVDQNKEPKPAIHATVFDSSDGVRSLAHPGHYAPQVAKTPDGRIWFLPWDGVSVFDPRNLHLNKLPPPVHIEQITANRKTYDVTVANGNLRLPPLIRDLQIDYTALSLVAPEKIQFRYKLEGRDRDWQEAGTRRQAFYGNLPPRNYRFRVIACNNSGVWNEAGTSLDFFVAPAYYQTFWFRSLCVVVFLGVLIVAYRLRLQEVERQFNLRLEGRVAERTRIARDLHDTLLQSFQGVLLKFHAVSYMLSDRPEAQKTLAAVIEQARQAITDGRDAVQELRSSTLAGNDLARAISMLGEELTTNQSGNPRPEFRVQVEGTPRDLAPILRDDLYRIAGEAMRNTFCHARASRIEVEILYEQRQLRLRIRDDGKGIDPKVLEAGARAGHYGLPGMHERAKLVGGKLTVWSALDSGTEAELTIPASIAYAKSGAAPRTTFSQTGTD
jgi:signal transduction histidine kinase/ligand-binding sensor domain-containing protein